MSAIVIGITPTMGTNQIGSPAILGSNMVSSFSNRLIISSLIHGFSVVARTQIGIPLPRNRFQKLSNSFETKANC